jgi:protein-S-isoprenylcysteine O-methyltransferase Ste14
MTLDIIIIPLSLVWVGSEITLARIKHSGSMDLRCDKSSLRVLWITIALAINFGIIFSFQSIGHFGNGSPIAPLTGLVLIVCGLIVRWIAILSLKGLFTVDVSFSKDHHLVMQGIYRFVRHPAYAGSLVSFLGLAFCFSNYISMVVIFVPIAAAFLHRIHIEEDALTNMFGGEYLDYCATTRRLIPGIF